MLKPMPSPSGTNRAGLFINTRAPHAAYDSKFGLRRMARDDVGDGPDDNLVVPGDMYLKIIDFLKTKIDAKDMAVVDHILQGNDLASDEPVDFQGKPKIGGTMVPLKAMDSLRGRLYAGERKTSASRRNLLAHMARIGTV